MPALNPVEVEQQILDVAAHIEKGVAVISEAEGEFNATKRAYDRAWAIAYGMSEGSVKDKEVKAGLATMDARETFEIAEVKFHHAQRLGRALEKKLDALRSVGASVRASYVGTM